LESAVYNSGCLRVGDEILAVNLVDVTKMSLDDVVIIMSIPRRLVLAIRTRRGRSSNSPQPVTRSEQKPPVVVIKRDLRDDNDLIMDEADHMARSRGSRDRRTGDGREMSESRSRLGLGLTNYSPQSEQLDLYYNSRNAMDHGTPNWNYKPPAPPPVITEQPKGVHQFQTSNNYYQNAGTLESLAEKVHSFYPGSNRRMSDTRAGIPMSQSHQRFPRSGSADILPRVEYTDYSASLGRHSFLRSSIKSAGGAPHPQQQMSGGTLGRYGRMDQSSRNAIKYSSPTSSGMARHKPPLDYSSDTEATISRPNYYYYNKQQQQQQHATLGRGGGAAALGGGVDFAKFNSLPRDKNVANARLNLRSRLIDRIGSEDDGNLSAPEYSLPALRRGGERGK
jgi:Rho GTPase-activating protein SYDE